MRIVGSLLTCIVCICAAGCAQIETHPGNLNRALSYIDTNTTSTQATVAIDRGMGVSVKGLVIGQKPVNRVMPIPFDYAWHPMPSWLLKDDDLFFATTLISTDTSQNFDADGCYAERIKEIASRKQLSPERKRQAISDELVQPILQGMQKSYFGLNDASLESARWVAWIAAQPAPPPSAQRTQLTTHFPQLRTNKISAACRSRRLINSLGGASTYFDQTSEVIPQPTKNRRYPSDAEFARAIVTPEISVRIEREHQEIWLPFWSSVSDVEQSTHQAVAAIVRDARFLPISLQQSDRFAAQQRFFIVFADVPADIGKINALRAQETEKADYLLAPGDILIMQ